MNERFSIRPERPGTEPSISEDDVVSGEIGSVESREDDPAAEALRRIEAVARQDAVLSEILDSAGGGSPAERAALIVERINALRRELAGADLDPAAKRERDRWLSDIANRLRELL